MKKMKVLVVLLAVVMLLSVFAACTPAAPEAPADEPAEEPAAEEPEAQEPEAQEPEAQEPEAEEPEAEPTIIDMIKEQGFITLGTSADYPPYEFHAPIDGQDTIVGFDIAIAQAIADELGVELKISDMNFDGLLAALMSGNVDFVIAGMSPTEERAESVDFSEIYYFAQQGVLVRTEDTDMYTSIEDLSGKKVGAQLGSIQEGIVKDQMPDATLVAIPKIPDLVLELTTKKVEAVVMEIPVAESYVAAVGGLAISDVAVEDDTGGSAVAIAKGNEEFVTLINEILADLIADGSISAFYADAKEIEDSLSE